MLRTIHSSGAQVSIDNFHFKRAPNEFICNSGTTGFYNLLKQKSNILRAFLLHSGNLTAFKLPSIFLLYLVVDYEDIWV